MGENYQRNEFMGGSHLPPGPSTQEFIQNFLGSILGGPSGVANVGGLEGSWDPEYLSRDEEPKLGVVSRGKKLARAAAITRLSKNLEPMVSSSESRTPGAAIHDIVNQRDSLYHGTNLSGVKGILEGGSIKGFAPEGSTVPSVSISRVPVSRKPAFPFTLEIDPQKTGPTGAVAPLGSRKVNASGRGMSSNFEFENRSTTDIPADAIKRLHINREELRYGYDKAERDRMLAEVYRTASSYGIPVKEWPSSKTMESSRAKLTPNEIKDQLDTLLGRERP